MAVLGWVIPLLAAGGWLWLIYINDRFEKEPLGLIARTAGLGAAAGLGSLAISAGARSGLAGEPVRIALVQTPIHLVALVTVILAYPFRNPNWNEPFDGLMYGGAAGAGYGLIFSLPALFVSSELGFRIAAFSIPVFMLAGVVLGHYMSRAKFGRRRIAWRAWLRGLGVAGLFLFGIEVALGEGAQVLVGQHMLAGLLAYSANTLAWIIATRAMDLSAQESPYNPEPRLRLAPVPCRACGARYPAEAAYCSDCGESVRRPGGGAAT